MASATFSLGDEEYHDKWPSVWVHGIPKDGRVEVHDDRDEPNCKRVLIIGKDDILMTMYLFFDGKERDKDEDA